MKKLVFALLLSSIIFTGCADLNSPYGSPYNNSPYNSPYNAPYGGGYGGGYDSRRDIDQSRRERDELERERRRAEEERRRLERERERAERNGGSSNQGWNNSPPPQSRPADRCPPGFSPSEQKCSSQERRNGCRDIRTPGGLGCVSR